MKSKIPAAFHSVLYPALLLLVAAASGATHAPAQRAASSKQPASQAGHATRMAMPEGRILQMFDLRRAKAGELSMQPFGKEAAKHAVTILRRFVDPPLRVGDDIQAMGSNWVAVLADAERIASVDRLFQAAHAHRDDLVTIEVRLLTFSEQKFRKHLRDDLVKVERGSSNTFEAVVGKAKAKTFLEQCLKASEQALASPKIAVMPLQRANVSVVKQVSYVRDFTVQRTDHAAIADPVVDIAWEGHKSDVCATFLPGGRIGLSCDVHFQELHRPIPEVKTTVIEGTLPVTIQLPRTSGVRLANVAEIEAGSLVVLAAQRSDGEYLVAIVKANATGHR